LREDEGNNANNLARRDAGHACDWHGARNGSKLRPARGHDLGQATKLHREFGR
jgi:hypothetical protein